MGKIHAICTSVRRGTPKKRFEEAELITDFGIKGDAHAGKWHRQVSLLSYETITAFNEKGAGVKDGAFGENLVIEGLDLVNLPLGTKFFCGETVMELTQIGKKCHDRCQIYYKVGTCIMPTNGIFAVVLAGGQIKVGDEITAVLSDQSSLNFPE